VRRSGLQCTTACVIIAKVPTRSGAEHTSFQRVRDTLRRDVAVSALARGDASIEALSERLGFSEPSAFHRAFRRWTGATPRSYQGSYQEPGRDRAASTSA